MTAPFEDLIDDLRSGAIDDTGQRRLSMVLRSQRSAALDLALLDLFDEPRALQDDDFAVDDLVAATLAQVDENRESSVAPSPARASAPVPPPPPVPDVLERAKHTAEKLARQTANDGFVPRMPFDPIVPADPAAARSTAEPAITPVSRKALGRPYFSANLTTTQKLAVQLAKRPFLRPWLAAAVVLLSLSTGWTARGLFIPEPAPPPPVAKIVPAPVEEEETRSLGSDDLLAFAENAVGRDQLERAARLYEELIRRFPRSPEAPMARLGLARLQLEAMDAPADAAATYADFLAAHPDDDLSSDAALGRAQALEAAGHRDAAGAWRAIARDYPGTEAAAQARRHR